MQFNFIKLLRDEYTDGEYGYRTYELTVFGVPTYRACYRTTNKQAISVLNTIKTKKPVVGGFTKNTDET